MCAAALALALVALLTTGCGPDPSDAYPSTTTTSDEAVDAETEETASSTTAPPTTAPPTTAAPADDPAETIQVRLVGDSVMANVQPAVIEALEGGGAAEASYESALFLPRPGFALDEWQAGLEQEGVDVVVLLLGGWELDADEGGPSTPGWSERITGYVAQTVDAANEVGAQVLWIAVPPSVDPVASAGTAFIDAAIADVAAARDPEQLTFVDVNEQLVGPDGLYVDLGTDAAGQPVRLRKLDGRHLCPAGVVPVAGEVLSIIQERFDVAVEQGWEQGEWTRDIKPDPAACPPASDPAVASPPS
jgi:hypothetical protein